MNNYKTVIVIEKPPIKFVKYNKQKRKNETFYLTGNLFFDRNVWTVNQIIQDCKRYLKPYFKDVPPLDSMELDLFFERNTTQFDLDNKGYFWEKVFFDLMKRPSEIQLDRALEKRKEIITCNVLKDDTVKYVNAINKRFKKGGNRMTFTIEGKLWEEPQTLFK